MRIAIIGAGVVGLGTTYELLRRGHTADCYEAARPMAARSVGDTRIFRLAHADPELVDSAMRARRGWAAWSELAGEPLVGTQGTVVSGGIEPMVTAMRAAGAEHTVADKEPRLPAADPVGPFLIDPAGGAIRAAATGRFLLRTVRPVGARVTRVDPDGTVTSAVGTSRYDAVLIAAGAGTPELAAGAGIAIVQRTEQHTRCTFPLRDPSAAPPCWLDRSHAWRDGFTSYGHLAGPGRWAVGGHLPRDLPDEGVLGAYIEEYVDGALPQVVETVHCEPIAGAGDGINHERADRVHAVWGNNLFKHAPYLAGVLADRLS
jgi:glycine/D-amino acid oxidase-like deaminating enzyme